MRVSQTLLNSVVFVGVETDGEFTPYGTGFLAKLTDEEVSWTFVVTAAHIFTKMSDETKKRTAYRLNRRDGTAETIRLNFDVRMWHENEANDVMLFPVRHDPTTYDFNVADIRRSTIEMQRTRDGGVQPGDEVCMAGLYTSHYGRIRNVPVVRTGNVAAVPGEPVQTEFGYTPAYLVELRSIAGLSGSPVFQTFASADARSAHGGVIIGVMVGYHRVESKEDQILVPRFQGAAAIDEPYSRDELNTGFGVVIPIERICDILEEEESAKERQTAKEAFRAQSGYRPANVSVPASLAPEPDPEKR